MVEVKKKLLLLGDGAVGKTSLVRRFVTDNFDDRYITTIGAKVTKKDIQFKVGQQPTRFSMMLWDVLGQQGYSNIQKASFAGADGALLVCDVTRAQTVESLKNYWIPNFKAAPMIFLANKADLKEREVGPQEMFDLAGENNANFFFTSAKNGMNVNLAFYKLAFYVLKKMDAQADVESNEGDIYKPQIEEKDSYNAIEVADMIMTDFCATDDVVGIDGTMEILVPQFDRAGVDVKNPTKEGLARVVNNLAEMEIMLNDPDVVEASKQKRLGWVQKIVQ
ncbi:MAG: GTP-binding protein [Candidatus Thermoplasmatota archaeon]|nr:GTP-binding protein [Candidatus Thermoplasmatota archaeon]